MNTHKITHKANAGTSKKGNKKVVKHLRAKSHAKVVTKRVKVSKPVKKMHLHASKPMRVVTKQIQRPARKKIEVIAAIANVADEATINSAIEDVNFTSYIARSVGKRTGDIIKLLAEPQTDDLIAEKLGIKINEVRRMLNMLNAYGVARYNVNKDGRGWLTFKWYIDSNKLAEMRSDLIAKSKESAYKVPDGCDDFFICDKCYVNQKAIFPFDTAFEMNFKCDCGVAMKRISKDELSQLVIKQESKVL